MDFVRYANPPIPPVLNKQNQDEWNTKQNQLKNTHLFHIVFEVLKVLFIKICKMQPLDLLFLVALCYISRYHFSLIFRVSYII